MQSEMNFYMTTHFVERNSLSVERLQQILETCYIIKGTQHTDSLQKTTQEVREHIYGYQKTKTKRRVIVIARDFGTGLFNVLVTIYDINGPGWITNAFRKIKPSKRKFLKHYLDFKHAKVIRRERKEEASHEENIKAVLRDNYIPLSAHNFKTKKGAMQCH